MMQIFYENSKGDKLDLLTYPYRLQTGNLFDYNWTYENGGQLRISGTITRFVKEPQEMNMLLTVASANRQDYYQALNDFFEVVDYDVVNKRHGKLWIGEQYMLCYIYSSAKTEWEYGIESLDNDITLVSDYPFWITEKQYIFRYIAEEHKLYLDYPYDYSYDYTSENNSHKDYMTNTHYCACHFFTEFFGPCVNPSFSIDRYPHTVYTTLEEGERLQIDSRTKTITKVTATGDKKNEYNNRRKDISIFERIEPGLHMVTWNGIYSFYVTLYEERSEPKWS